MTREPPIVLVTGSTDGIGRQTALELVRHGATVIVHGRKATRTESVRAELRRAAGRGRLESVTFDLSSLSAVRDGAMALVERYPRIDVLILNAGVFMNHRTLTQDGFETTFGVNHLAHFLLTQRLLPALRASPQGRVVTVSSGAHRGGRMRWDDLQLAQGFTGYEAYAQSKLANLLFAFELATRLAGTGITSNALHPGVIATKLLHEGFGLGGSPLEKGAATSVYAALDPSLATVTGRYFDQCREARPAPQALDVEAQHRLWQLSEALCASGSTPPPKGSTPPVSG